MGAAVAKILRKDVPGDPVLGMRRTQRMRDLDTDKKMRQKRKLRRLDRVQRRYVGTLPSGVEAVREKVMRKTASRAIVALFNAIVKRQHPHLMPIAAFTASVDSTRTPAERRSTTEVKGANAIAVDALGDNWDDSEYLLDVRSGMREAAAAAHDEMDKHGIGLHTFLHSKGRLKQSIHPF